MMLILKYIYFRDDIGEKENLEMIMKFILLKKLFLVSEINIIQLF